MPYLRAQLAESAEQLAMSEERLEAAKSREVDMLSFGDEVGRCRLTASKPVLIAPMVSALKTRISQTAFNVIYVRLMFRV